MDFSTRERVRDLAPRLMEQLVQPSGGLYVVRFTSTGMLAEALVRLRFTYSLMQPFGPPGGRQLFFTNGLLTVRCKTLGDARGPRANRPHVSVGMTTGAGDNAWFNDVAKINALGQLAAKSITVPERFQPKDFEGKDQRFVMIQGGLSLDRFGPAGLDARADAWADRTHFGFPNNQVIDDLGIPVA
ncbi:MAG TPA: hypothetical protein VM510_04060 [Caulifigura sp.]|nr:hypothetical protein [Caulifigura sp.]